MEKARRTRPGLEAADTVLEVREAAQITTRMEWDALLRRTVDRQGHDVVRSADEHAASPRLDPCPDRVGRDLDRELERSRPLRFRLDGDATADPAQFDGFCRLSCNRDRGRAGPGFADDQLAVERERRKERLSRSRRRDAEKRKEPETDHGHERKGRPEGMSRRPAALL